MAPTEPEIDIYPCGPGDQEAVVNCSLSAFYYKYEDSNSEGRTASIFRNQFSKAMGDPNHTCFKAVDLDTKKNLLGVIHVVYRQPKEKSEENPTVRGVIVDNNLFKRGKTDPYFYIEEVAVHSDQKLNKIGRRLMAHAEKFIRESLGKQPAKLVVLTTDKGNFPFYEKMGFFPMPKADSDHDLEFNPKDDGTSMWYHEI